MARKLHFYLQRSIADLQKADDLKLYVDWAANLGYAVIDVNVPKHLTNIEVCSTQFWKFKGIADKCVRTAKAMGWKTGLSAYLLVMSLLYIFGRTT